MDADMDRRLSIYGWVGIYLLVNTGKYFSTLWVTHTCMRSRAPCAAPRAPVARMAAARTGVPLQRCIPAFSRGSSRNARRPRGRVVSRRRLSAVSEDSGGAREAEGADDNGGLSFGAGAGLGAVVGLVLVFAVTVGGSYVYKDQITALLDAFTQTLASQVRVRAPMPPAPLSIASLHHH